MGKARASAKKMAKGSLEPSGARPVSHAEVGVPRAEVGARDEPTNVFGGGPDDFTTPVGLAYGALVVAIFFARMGLMAVHSFTLIASRADDAIMQHWAAHPRLFVAFFVARMPAMSWRAGGNHPGVRPPGAVTGGVARAGV